MVALVPEQPGPRDESEPEPQQPAGDVPARRPIDDMPPAWVRAVFERDSVTTEIPAADADSALPADRRTWMPSAGCRIIACVDVRPIPGSEPDSVAPHALWDLAVRRMERCVRPGDWMCMLGGTRLAMCFGDGANRIPPSALGRRLARAMGDHLVVGTKSAKLEVAVGIGVSTDEFEPAQITDAAMASIRSARHHHRLGSGAVPPFVAVSRLSDGAVSTSARCIDGSPSLPHMPSSRPRRLVRRVVVPLGDEARAVEHDRSSPFRPAKLGEQSGPRVLIVDPHQKEHDSSRLASILAGTIAGKAGALPAVCRATSIEGVLLDHYMLEPRAVVLLLQSQITVDGNGASSPDPWANVAKLTKSLHQAGATVIAVSLGASAMAVAACVEFGAIGLLGVESLPAELARIVTDSAWAAERPDARRVPTPYDSLMLLTASERRVLYCLMQGQSAQEIAAEQVVAMSTIRTHIRSILRKLNVGSQLAAVAIANGASAISA